MQFLLLGNPQNRRTHYFVEAAKTQGFAAPIVISYLDVLQQKSNLADYLPQVDVLRLDSPGENFEVSRQFLQLGFRHPAIGNAPQLSPSAIAKLSFDRGRIRFLRQQHLGFFRFLEQLQAQLKGYPHLKMMNSPQAIRLMFDKIACHQHFKKNNISTPPALYNIQGYDDLRQRIQQKGWKAVFIKPTFNSSASGTIAYRYHRDKEQAITSAQMIDSPKGWHIYNNLNIQKYRNHQKIKYLIDYLAQEGIIVERWIPKASLPQGVFDLRILVIAGQAQQVVVRQSQSPMTNLHLGNQRGNLQALKKQIGQQTFKKLLVLAEKAAQSLPQTLYVGMDVMLNSTLKKAYVLEANAFGDLLPRVLVNKKNTYESIVAHYK